MRLELDFEQWMETGRALATIRPPSEREKSPARVAVDGGQAMSATVRIRGMSSPAELTYPKLKVKVKEPTSGTSLVGVEEFAINTHGFDAREGAVSALGRLMDPVAVGREAGVYDLASEMGFTVRGHRRAEVEYRDTASRKVVKGPALLLEDVDALAKRHGGKEIEFDQPARATDVVPTPEIARIALFQAMLGNWDWDLKPKIEAADSAHNVTLIRRANGTLIPVLEDFDMASIVTGSPRRTPQMTAQFFPQGTPFFRETMWELMTDVRPNNAPADLFLAAEDMLKREPQVRKAVDALPLDPKGKELFNERVETFYSILKSRVWLTTPMTTAPVVMLNKPGGKPIADLVPNAPLEVLERKGDWVKVSSGFRVLQRNPGATVTEGWIPSSSAVQLQPQS